MCAQEPVMYDYKLQMVYNAGFHLGRGGVFSLETLLPIPWKCPLNTMQVRQLLATTYFANTLRFHSLWTMKHSKVDNLSAGTPSETQFINDPLHSLLPFCTCHPRGQTKGCREVEVLPNWQCAHHDIILQRYAAQINSSETSRDTLTSQKKPLTSVNIHWGSNSCIVPQLF